MKQNIHKILVFLVLALLVSPGASLFSFHLAQAAPINLALPEPSQTRQINVVSAPVTAQVVAFSAKSHIAKNSSCLSPEPTVTNILQNASALNLNQMPGCFNLVPAMVAVQPTLRVVAVASAAVIVVVENSRLMAAPDYAPLPVAAEKSVPLVAGVILFAVAVFGESVCVKTNKTTPRIKAALTLQQLQMMRC